MYSLPSTGSHYQSHCHKHRMSMLVLVLSRCVLFGAIGLFLHALYRLHPQVIDQKRNRLIFTSMHAAAEKTVPAVAVNVSSPEAAIPSITISSYKQLFKAPKRTAVAREQPAMPADGVRQRIEHMRITGVILGANPTAALYDRLSGETVFINQGMTFDGFTIRSIEEGEVTLKYENTSYRITY